MTFSFYIPVLLSNYSSFNGSKLKLICDVIFIIDLLKNEYLQKKPGKIYPIFSYVCTYV